LSPTVRGFIYSGFVYLLLGGLFGIISGTFPATVDTLRAAHAHAMLLGFVSFFIFGVAYHILPRFHGKTLHNERLATVHLVIGNIGVAGMVVLFLVRGGYGTDIAAAFAAAGTLEYVGFILLVYNLLRTVVPAVRAGNLPNVR